MASKYSKSAYNVTPLSADEVARLAKSLDEETFLITQRSGTERPFCGNLLDNKTDGVYCCIVCGLPLFSSVRKFDSGTGWPSFNAPFDDDHVRQTRDVSHGMLRIEIACARCNAHLGHVFDDGPPPTRQRHCLNSASLRFYADGEERPPESRPVETETAYFAGGCFWGIEHYFQLGEGVVSAVSGFMHGADAPTYEAVCSGTTGHAETVQVAFDPTRITYEELLAAFFRMHDPTQVDRQGPDVGSQYRSGVYPVNEEQHAAAKAYVAELASSNGYAGSLATEIVPAAQFWPAEDYHQDYIARTGRACHVKNPWV